MDKSRLQLAASRRRRARGVAMVEGAVIFPIMAFFLLYLELAHHSFDGYLLAEHVSEQRTWSAATVGGFASCKDFRDDAAYKPSYVEILPSGSGSGDDSVGGVPSTNSNGGRINGSAAAGAGPGGLFMHHDGAQVQVTVKRGGIVYDGAAHKPSASSKVFCNQPWYGGVIDIVKSIF